MILAFLNMGGMELVIVLISLLLIIVLGNYGKDTALGYWGTILLSVFLTPIVALAVVLYLKNKPAN